MTDTVKAIVSIISRGVCSGMQCTECHEIFGTPECPIDFTTEDEKHDFAVKFMDRLNNKSDVDDLDLDDILNILYSE